MWLPLALSDIYMAIVAVARLQAGKDSGIEVPQRSATLASWMLPIMSRACKSAEDEAKEELEADERERGALALFNMVKNLEKKYGQK